MVRVEGWEAAIVKFITEGEKVRDAFAGRPAARKQHRVSPPPQEVSLAPMCVAASTDNSGVYEYAGTPALPPPPADFTLTVNKRIDTKGALMQCFSRTGGFEHLSGLGGI